MSAAAERGGTPLGRGASARRRARWRPPGWRWLVPRGLLGRSLLIILVPLLVVQGIALQLFYGTHLGVISRRLADGMAGEIGMVIETMNRLPPDSDQRWLFQEASWRLDLSLAFEPGAVLSAPEGPRAASLPLLPLEEDLERGLRERLRLPFDADWQSDPRSVIVRVQLNEGVLHVEAPRKRLFVGTLYLFVIWLVGVSLLLFVVAALFMKNQVRALRRLAGAAEAFGIGRDIGPIKPEGAIEVRQAATAFNQMQARIRRFVAQRTEMLAGISHDLRTPLTRMRLGLAMLPAAGAEQDIAELTQDVEEMERMVASYLTFARGEGQGRSEPGDLVALAEELAAKARRDGAAVAVRAPAELVLPMRADALRRCLQNLLDNARKHAGRVSLTVAQAGDGWAEVIVDDDGSGIPGEAREEAFRPFATLTAGGTGLGLAIARDIARAHGGDILLEDSPLGGLRARVRLPL
ncbi:ATP-binding protein [Roseomonas sp. BN140053]|uniref:ATP-binding protein n=1 Tax=Roseomonas sp. BN140053 TaxID=3391898 RepID=UPI0039EACB65